MARGAARPWRWPGRAQSASDGRASADGWRGPNMGPSVDRRAVRRLRGGCRNRVGRGHGIRPCGSERSASADRSEVVVLRHRESAVAGIAHGVTGRRVLDVCLMSDLFTFFAFGRRPAERWTNPRERGVALPRTGTYAQVDNDVKSNGGPETRVRLHGNPGSARCRGWSRFHNAASPRWACKTIWSPLAWPTIPRVALALLPEQTAAKAHRRFRRTASLAGCGLRRCANHDGGS